jgi:hypothetical protein
LKLLSSPWSYVVPINISEQPIVVHSPDKSVKTLRADTGNPAYFGFGGIVNSAAGTNLSQNQIARLLNLMKKADGCRTTLVLRHQTHLRRSDCAY